ncbi:MAG: GDP-L-fucose synthase [Dehalococcoidales bacterium]|nr:GDP-L-fucose synthase [Dehalococcoidales bacterium]
MIKEAKIFIAGDEGMVGSSLVRHLEDVGCSNITTEKSIGLDLLKQSDVSGFFDSEKPDYVFLSSVRIGSIQTNIKYPADYIYENLQAQNNVIHSAWKSGVQKLLFLGSNCVYPKLSPQPMKEEYLFTGPVEPTSEPYAMAKIAGIRMCQAYKTQYQADFISAVPATYYGPGSSFNSEQSHVLTALLRRAHDAKVNGDENLTVWGTGTPVREFIYIDDLTDALVFLMDNYDQTEMINVGTGEEISIYNLSMIIKDVVGFEGRIDFDESMPDGAPRKLLDCSKLEGLGWRPKVDLEEGIRKTYQWFLRNNAL